MTTAWRVVCKSCGHAGERCKAMPYGTQCCDKPDFTIEDYDGPRPREEVQVAVALYMAFMMPAVPQPPNEAWKAIFKKDK